MTKNARKIFVRKPEDKWPPERLGRRWKNTTQHSSYCTTVPPCVKNKGSAFCPHGVFIYPVLLLQ